MDAVRWEPEILIARGSDMHSSLAEVISKARRRRGLKIQVERSRIWPVPDSVEDGAPTKAQLREGCIKAIELGMQPLPQKARVLAEIHRRIDCLADAEVGSWQSGLAAIVSFTGAWALAARLICAGLSVCIREEGADVESLGGMHQGRADVEVLIPISPAQWN